jgi:hypothetical protein
MKMNLNISLFPPVSPPHSSPRSVEMLDIILEKGSGRRTRALGQSAFQPVFPPEGRYSAVPFCRCHATQASVSTSSLLGAEGMMLHLQKAQNRRPVYMEPSEHDGEGGSLARMRPY